MTCKHVSNRLSAYLDGELAGSEMLELRRHIQECGNCGQEADDLRDLKSMLAAPDTCAPAPDFESRLVAHVLRAERLTPTPSWRAHLGIAGVALTAGALAFVLATKASGPVQTPQIADIAYSSEMTQDQAYFIGSDPLGGTSVVPVSYAGH